MDEQEFVKKVNSCGGRAFVVGGWVRDRLRGSEAHDKDYVVSGLSAADFAAAFPEAVCVGKSFPVFLVNIADAKCEVALARTERKIGTGYTGFAVTADKSVTIEADLFRRDTTINAIAMELSSEKIIDPYGGEADIKAKRIRAVSEHFLEDPVRSLRAARQAAVFEYEIEPETTALMRHSLAELLLEPAERIFGEMEKALQADKPSIFFRELKKADLLAGIFPELAALIGKTQPVEFHPEGDAFEHSMDILDKVSGATADIVARFAALVHDIGKGTTPLDMLPHHYDHEIRGGAELAKWNRRMTIPHKWYQTSEYVIREHMRVPRLEKLGKMVDTINAIRQLPIEASGVLAIFAADHNGLPDYLRDYEENKKLLLTVSGKDAPKTLKGPEIGEWIRAQQIGLLKRKYGHTKN